MISASQIYDYVQCPHRVALDVHGDPSQRDEPNAFVEMLWKQGGDHEKQIIAGLGVSIDISSLPEADRARETIAAMQRGEPLIYSGCISTGDLVGIPDLLERRGNGYVPGDIKSGAGFDGSDEEGKLKKHYAYQLAHYVKILADIGFGNGTHDTFIVDRTGRRAEYPLDDPMGVRNQVSWWESYQEALAEVQSLVGGSNSRGAVAAACKQCHWYSHCKKEMIASDDLTLIAELGRNLRDAMSGTINTVHELAACNPESFIQGKRTVFSGIGPDRLIKFHERAKLLVTPGAKPYLKEPINLPVAQKEVFFDIEADPLRDVVYLHGFVERTHQQPASARFVPFFAEGIDPDQEKDAFRQAWAYLSERIKDSIIYYYSPYERTAYKKLAEKFPDVCSVSDVETLFANEAMIDLYTDIVRKKTEWPTHDQSIKTLAQYLGFKWRDTHPSGAASIEWYHRWIESGDPEVRQRILDYNEDDCLATGVVIDCVISI